MNKNHLILAALIAGLAPFAHAANVGVTVEVGQPGFYGRIDIGRFPQPLVVNPQPVIIRSQPVVVAPQPMYLRVPPGHQKHWGKFCGRYRACGQPVYFVQDQWYQTQVVPQYRSHQAAHPSRPGAMPREEHEGRHQGGRDDRHDRGKGHGRGHGHDRKD